jgi:hypothetical protein
LQVYGAFSIFAAGWGKLELDNQVEGEATMRISQRPVLSFCKAAEKLAVAIAIEMLSRG